MTGETLQNKQILSFLERVSQTEETVLIMDEGAEVTGMETCRFSRRFSPDKIIKKESVYPYYVKIKDLHLDLLHSFAHYDLGLLAYYSANKLNLPLVMMFTSYAPGKSFSIFRTFPEYPGSPARAAAEEMAKAFHLQYGGRLLTPQEIFEGTGDFNLCTLTKSFQPGGQDFGEDFFFAGAQIAPRAGDGSWKAPDNGKPLLYTSLGSLFNNWPEFYQMLFPVVKDLDVNVLCSIGKTIQKEDLGEIPENVTVMPFTPQLEVLAHTDYFITHAGIGSVMEALYFGVPCMCIPQMDEQVLTAHRLKELGGASAVLLKQEVTEIMKKISKWTYDQADLITISSKSFKKYFEKEHNITESKKGLIYRPSYAESVYENVGYEENDYFDLMFAGNIGPAQSCETIIECANLLKQYETIRFHFVGDGLSCQNCKDLAKEYGLDNVFFHGFHNIDDMADYYRMADALLITMQDNEVVNSTLPAKIQSYMLAGKPIFGAISGEVKNTVKEADCGACVSSGDYAGLAEIILENYQNKDALRLWGNNGYKYYKENFEKEVCLDQIEDSLKEASRKRLNEDNKKQKFLRRNTRIFEEVQVV